MIDLYFWPTPNGYKISIFLEEAGMPYNLHTVHIGKGQQFEPAFQKISPNGRIPALVDSAPAGGGAPIAIFESGAILNYLGEKTGQFLAPDLRKKTETLQWLFWQMAGLGPMLGQNHHFNQYAPEKIPYAMDRYTKETGRLYGVLDRQLSGRDFITGEYSIADMAAYPWIVPHEKQKQNLADFPNLKAWFERIGARPAVVRAYAQGKAINPTSTMTEDAKKIMFGQTTPGKPG